MDFVKVGKQKQSQSFKVFVHCHFNSGGGDNSAPILQLSFVSINDDSYFHCPTYYDDSVDVFILYSIYKYRFIE